MRLGHPAMMPKAVTLFGPNMLEYPNFGIELSVIIVNWNSMDYLRECLVSLYAHTKDVHFEVIVVDNASTQRNIDELPQQFPAVTLINSPQNIGFARANNLGFSCSSGSYILFLNPDTRLLGPAIRVILGHLKSLPQAGIVGCKLLNSDQSVQTSCIQKFPTILNLATDVEYLRLRWPHFRLWAIDPLFAENPQPVKVEVISGACMMMKREVFERTGMFSEDYFMYAEDLDLCYKAARAGFTNYYLGDAELIHHGGKSSSRQEVSDWATRMKFGAILQFCRKTRGHFYGWLLRVTIGVVAAVRLLVIALLFPFFEGRTGRSAFSKWKAVLKWSAGLYQQ
jgi:GT2 family glycosyltransferase